MFASTEEDVFSSGAQKLDDACAPNEEDVSKEDAFSFDAWKRRMCRWPRNLEPRSCTQLTPVS